jgi:hypothetical protein
MDITTIKQVYEVTFTQEEMYDIMMAAHHYLMREHPEFGEMFSKAGVSFIISVDKPYDYC